MVGPRHSRSPALPANRRPRNQGRRRRGPGALFRLQALAAGAGTARPAKVKNCILIWLAGGPSHIDTFDPKPDATPDIRGEFKAIDTSVPGLKISEILPNLAKIMNKATLIRSVTSPEADHVRAAQHL